MDNDEEREEEVSSLTAIFPEIEISPTDRFAFTLEVPVVPASPVQIRFISQDPHGSGDVEHKISHLPNLKLHMTLPEGYPSTKAPRVNLSTSPAWIPVEKLKVLEHQAKELWEQYGQAQMAYDYIDSLQQAAERVLDLPSGTNTLDLPHALQAAILAFDHEAAKRTFNAATFECGVCLDPKKGSACHKMHKCGHVFCVDCLQSAYDSAITGGDVSSVKCLEPDCGVERDAITKRATKAAPTLGPDELLEIPIVPATVVRYVNLKRKKRFESFPQTVYCPRKWCQGPAHRSRIKRKPVETMTAADLEPEAILADKDAEPKELRVNEDRLRICEDCDLAFCRTCLATWHGEFGPPCWPRTAAELTEDELASRAYMMKNTTPCPTCNFAVQKSMGCNHITCFSCNSHFCYLCSAWLDPGNPYEHFNKQGKSCYQRLWDMEEGDNADGNVQFLGIRGAEIAAAMAEEEALEMQRQQPVAQHQPDEEPDPDQNQDAQMQLLGQNVQQINLNAADGPDIAQLPAIAPDEDEAPPGFIRDAWGNIVQRPDWRNLRYEARPAGQPRRHPQQRADLPALGGRGNVRFHEGPDWRDGMGGGGGNRHVRERRALGRDAARQAEEVERAVGGGIGADEDDHLPLPRREARPPRAPPVDIARHLPAHQEAIHRNIPIQAADPNLPDPRAIAGLQRFLAMAAEDREDEWDSDEMEGDDEAWAIPVAPPRVGGAEGRERMGFLVGRR